MKVQGIKIVDDILLYIMHNWYPIMLRDYSKMTKNRSQGLSALISNMGEARSALIDA